MSATVEIERHTNAERFLTAAQAWLLEAEAENNLLLGMALNRRKPDPGNPRPVWATIRAGNAIVGCACRTPPHPLVLSRMPLHAIAALAESLGPADSWLSGVTGPVAETEAFANTWIGRHGGRFRVRIRLRLHELTHLSAPTSTPVGSLRQAAASHLALAREWIDAYVRDTGIQAPTGDMAGSLIERGQLFLWIDDADVRSMVAATRDTGSGCSINTVYTPPRFRRHGYATATVAALSGRLLENGHRFCCLYTDAANPTSNAIYAKLGYKPIRDDVEIAFEP